MVFIQEDIITSNGILELDNTQLGGDMFSDGDSKPPIWNEVKIYYTVLACLGIFLIVVGFREGWL